MAESTGGLREWTLESRVRYGLVWGGLSVLVVGGLTAMFGSLSVPELLLLALAGLVIAGLVHALIWYPRAKQRAASEQIPLRR